MQVSIKTNKQKSTHLTIYFVIYFYNHTIPVMSPQFQ